MRAPATRLYPFLLAAFIVIADRLSKWMVARAIPLNAPGIQVVPGLFHITHVENRGAAFGLFAESPTRWKIALLVGMSFLAMAVIGYLLWKSEAAFGPTAIGLSLILGGAVGNLWDRVVSGQVTDFLHFYIGSYSWPDFNVADSAIVVGAILLISEILFSKPHEAKEA